MVKIRKKKNAMLQRNSHFNFCNRALRHIYLPNIQYKRPTFKNIIDATVARAIKNINAKVHFMLLIIYVRKSDDIWCGVEP